MKQDKLNEIKNIVDTLIEKGFVKPEAREDLVKIFLEASPD